jgi:hypothetical protein
MIVRKETELSHANIILENDYEIDMVLQMCHTCLETYKAGIIREFAELIIDNIE